MIDTNTMPQRGSPVQGTASGMAVLSRPHRVLIALLVFNEAEHIAPLITAIRAKAPGCTLLVIDDGSTDDSQSVLKKLHVPFLRHEINRGKGAALRSALEEARRHRYRWIITMDGDGQHDPHNLPWFIREIETGTAELIIGCRQGKDRRMPLLRQLSNGISSIFISLFSGNRFHDAQCGFRAYRVDLPGLEICREEGFQYESEVLLRLSRCGCRFEEIPISTIYPSTGSHIRYLRDTARFIRLLWRMLWW